MKGNFDQIIHNTVPVIVDFHAEWCGPCKMQAPVLKEIASEFEDRIRVIKIDVDQNYEIASRYQVISVPTLIFFKQGKIIYRQAGVHSKNQIADIIKNHI